MRLNRDEYHFKRHVLPSKDEDYFIIPYRDTLDSIENAKLTYIKWANEVYNDPIDNKNVFGMYIDDTSGNRLYGKIRYNKHKTLHGAPYEIIFYTNDEISSFYPVKFNLIDKYLKNGKWKPLPIDDTSPVNLESLLKKH